MADSKNSKYIPQGGYDIIDKPDKAVRLYTSGIVYCSSVCIYNKDTAIMAHIDIFTDPSSVFEKVQPYIDKDTKIMITSRHDDRNIRVVRFFCQNLGINEKDIEVVIPKTISKGDSMNMTAEYQQDSKEFKCTVSKDNAHPSKEELKLDNFSRQFRKLSESNKQLEVIRKKHHISEEQFRQIIDTVRTNTKLTKLNFPNITIASCKYLELQIKGVLRPCLALNTILEMNYKAQGKHSIPVLQDAEEGAKRLKTK